MSNPVPNNLALATINTNDPVNSAPLRNDFSAVQIAVNQLIACLSGGTAGQRLQAVDGTDVQWVNQITYRKTTTKQVLNTVAETDLLNAEITVAAGVMGNTGLVRLTAWCDWVNNSGVAQQTIPRLKLKLGGTTLIDTNAFAVGNLIQSGSNRYPFIVSALIQNIGAPNSQLVELSVDWQAHQAGSALAGYTVAYATGTGFQTIGASAGANVPCAVSSKGNNTTAVDTTASQALALTVINPTATATCDTTLRAALVEIL